MSIKKKKKKNQINKQSKIEAPLISVCMIVKNEEKNLGKCLELANGFADEIIVVDTGSVDKTTSIAKKHGVRLFQFQWIDDYSAARNVSLKHARGKWIIWLDADDRIYPDQHPLIRKLAQEKPDRAFYFKLVNDGFEKSQCLQLRMFPNFKEIRFEKPVHEQVATSINRLGLPIVNSKVILYHTGYSSLEVVKTKKERYIGMMSKWLESQPGDNAIRYQYALALHTLKQNEKAKAEFEFLLNHSPDFKKTDPMYYFSSILLGRTYLELNDFDSALSALKTAEEINPNTAFLRISIAEVYVYSGNYDKAVQYLNETDINPEEEMSSFPLDYTILKYGKLVLLGKSKLELGYPESANSYLNEALELAPHKPDAYKFLAEVNRNTGNYKEVVHYYTLAKEKDPEYFYYDFKIGNLFLALGWLSKSKGYFKQSLEKLPNHPPILYNLAIIEQCSGRYDNALSYFSTLQKLEIWNDNFSPFFILCLMDKGDLLSISQKYSLYLNGKTKVWMSYLLDLYFEKTESFWTKFNGSHPELQEKSINEVVVHITKEIEQSINNKDFVLSELQLRVALFLDQKDTLRYLLQLADIQMKNNRLFQSINTFEQGINFTTNDQQVIAILDKMSRCYLQLGVDEAHQMCLKQIEQVKNNSIQPLLSSL